MMQHIDHIAVAVWNTDQSLPYYVGQLRLRVVHDEELPEIGVRLTYLDAGNTLFQLVQPIGPGAIRQFLEERGEGLHHVCFAVPDIPSVLQALDGEANARVFLGGRERRCCFLLSHPNGLITELTELEPYQPPVPSGTSREEEAVS